MQICDPTSKGKKKKKPEILIIPLTFYFVTWRKCYAIERRVLYVHYVHVIVIVFFLKVMHGYLTKWIERSWFNVPDSG